MPKEHWLPRLIEYTDPLPVGLLNALAEACQSNDSTLRWLVTTRTDLPATLTSALVVACANGDAVTRRAAVCAHVRALEDPEAAVAFIRAEGARCATVTERGEVYRQLLAELAPTQLRTVAGTQDPVLLLAYAYHADLLLDHDLLVRVLELIQAADPGTFPEAAFAEEFVELWASLDGRSPDLSCAVAHKITDPTVAEVLLRSRHYKDRMPSTHPRDPYRRADEHLRRVAGHTVPLLREPSAVAAWVSAAAELDPPWDVALALLFDQSRSDPDATDRALTALRAVLA